MRRNWLALGLGRSQMGEKVTVTGFHSGKRSKTLGVVASLLVVVFGLPSSADAWQVKVKNRPYHEFAEIETRCKPSERPCRIRVTIRRKGKVVFSHVMRAGGYREYDYNCKLEGRHHLISKSRGRTHRKRFNVGTCGPRRDRHVSRRVAAKWARKIARKAGGQVAGARCFHTFTGGTYGKAARWSCDVERYDLFRVCFDRLNFWFWRRNRFGFRLEWWSVPSHRRLSCRYH